MRLRARRKVDFPQPLGPMIAVTAFEATPRVTLSMARFSPYQIERFFTSNVHAVGVSASGGGAVPCSIRSDRKSTRLNSSHGYISYAVFCLKKKIKYN